MPPHLPLLIAVLLAPTQTAVRTVTPSCNQWRECQQQALEAAERRDYERFHDLAWRTVQIGPAGEPDLMWLLARAQALSGRPHDALIMIQRLADRGVAVDASGTEFERTRALRDWPSVAAALARHRPPAAAEPARPTPLPPPPPPATAAAPVTGSILGRARSAARPVTMQPAARSVAAQFAVPRLRAGGLAFDTVSQRFVVGDAGDRKLIVVGVGGTTPTDMVRAESAGFEDVAAIAIDTVRGDLWVAGAAGAVHRLQLVSGRPLRMYRAAPAAATARIVDLAIGPAGTVVALDAAGSRLLTLGRGAAELQSAMTLGVSGVTSLMIEDEATALVAHATGIVRADLRTHATTAITATDGIDLGGFEQLRSYRDSWIGLQRSAGTSRVVRLDVARGRRVTAATIIDDNGPEQADRAFLAISGDALYYLAATDPRGLDPLPIVIRELRLR